MIETKEPPRRSSTSSRPSLSSSSLRPHTYSSGDKKTYPSRDFTITRRIPTSTGVYEDKEEVFQGPEEVPPQPKIDNPSRHTYPVYAGIDGTLYDVDYCPVQQGTAESTQDAGDVYNIDELGKRAVNMASLSDVYSSFPVPQQFSDYESYDAALMKWKELVQRVLGYLETPHVMGRTLNRPQVGIKEREAEDETAEGEDVDGTRALNTTNTTTTILQRDPWDATLVLPEPKPSYYEDYDQYELAMQRWHDECCKKISFMLPHASQMQTMQTARIQPAREVFSASNNAMFTNVSGSGESSADFEFLRGKNGFRNPYSCDSWDSRLDQMRKKRAASYANMQHIPSLEGVSLHARPQMKTDAGLFMKALGTIQDDRIAQFKRAGIATNAPLVPENMTSPGAYDTKVSWEQIQKIVDDPSLDPSTDQYGRSVMQEVEAKRYTKRIAVQQIYHPVLLVSGNDRSSQMQAEAASILRNKRPLTIDDTIHILLMPLSCDVLARIADSRVPQSQEARTYYELFVSPINPGNWKQLLELWDTNRDNDVKTKLAWLVDRLLHEKPMPFIHCVADECTPSNCHMLYIMARCLSFGDPIQPDIFPFTEDGFRMVDFALLYWDKTNAIPFSSKCSEMLKDIFVIYYLHFYQRKLSDEHLTELVSKVEASLGDNLQRTAAFVSSLFYLMGHFSVTVSNTTLCAMLQLLRSSSGRHSSLNIQMYLRASEAAICDQLLTLSKSKYTQAQFATRRIMALLLSDSNWRSALDKYVSQKPDLINDMVEDPKDHHLSSPTTIFFINTMYLHAFNNVQDVNSAVHYWWITGDVSLTRLLRALMRAIGLKADSAAAALAHLVELLCFKSWSLGLLHVREEPLPETHRDITDRRIIVTPRTLLQIFEMIKVLGSATETQVMSVRASLLNAARVLLRKHEVFMLVRNNLMNRVISWCKDGKYLPFNKCAWRIFYELIEYHGGVLEYLDQSKQLTSFTDMVGATIYGNCVLVNCIHYIAKVFTLGKMEQQRIQANLPPKREDGRPARDDVKFFVNYFRDRSLFIKFHMIYIRVQKARSGAVFIELARFYNILSTVPECAKLLSTIQKNKDYREGLEMVMRMFIASE